MESYLSNSPPPLPEQGEVYKIVLNNLAALVTKICGDHKINEMLFIKLSLSPFPSKGVYKIVFNDLAALVTYICGDHKINERLFITPPHPHPQCGESTKAQLKN
jgi:hypothetical protein